jgi:hypothetical protein
MHILYIGSMDIYKQKRKEARLYRKQNKHKLNVSEAENFKIGSTYIYKKEINSISV